MRGEEANIREQFKTYLSEEYPSAAETILNAVDFGLEILLLYARELREGERIYSVTDRERVERWRELMRTEESWRKLDTTRALAKALTAYARFAERLDLDNEKTQLKPAKAPADPMAANRFTVDVANLTEGDAHEVVLTRYERNPRLRQLCIEAYGGSARCEICGFDFERHYGPRDAGKYIEVHHIAEHAATSRHKGQHKVDCLRDLIPLCANCHRMIHLLGRETLTPQQLKQIWEERHGK